MIDENMLNIEQTFAMVGGVAIPRLGVLWCPNWSVVAAHADPGEQVIVLHGNHVVAQSLAAGREGVEAGLRRRQAQAICPAARLVAHDPDADARQFEKVVTVIAELIPRVEVTEPGMLSFLAKGPSRYFGGEQAMAERMLRLATEVVGDDGPLSHSLGAVGGFGIGIADGRFAAAISARRSAAGHHQPLVVAGKSTAAFLAPLPVLLLATVGGLEHDLVELLQRLGIRTLGQLAALSMADVTARFGWQGAFAHRLAGGGDDRPPDTADPPAGLVAMHVLDDPAHHVDMLVFIARHLADELVTTLAQDGKVCTRLVITAETDHGERNERLWYRSTGLSSAAMVERARWQLDAWVNGGGLTAGVTMLRLEPVEVRRDDGVQLGLWGGRTQADEWAARAVARLATIAGAEHVRVPAAGGGRSPSDAYTWVPAVTADLADPGERLTPVDGPWPGRLPSPAPAVVHPEPLPIDVLDEHGRSVRVTGRGTISAPPVVVRGVRGDEPVVAWGGPWPLDERWWDATRARRAARFQLLTASGSLLLVSLERQTWWLLGEYR